MGSSPYAGLFPDPWLMTHITPNQTLFLFYPIQGHSLLNMVHQDEPEEASEPDTRDMRDTR